jgi:hypothetical protein
MLSLRPFTYKPSKYIPSNQNSGEELIADTGAIAPIIIQKIKDSPDFKTIPKLIDSILIKQFIFLNLFNWCCFYIYFFCIDQRQRIARIIITYFNGSKYKSNFLFI